MAYNKLPVEITHFFNVEEMINKGCEQIIKSTLEAKNKDYIKKVVANSENKTVRIKLKKQIDSTKFIDDLEKLNYTAKLIRTEESHLKAIYYYNVEGMTCTNCENMIERIVGADLRKYIKKIKASFASKTVKIMLKEYAHPFIFVNALSQIGFSAEYTNKKANFTYLYFEIEGISEECQAKEIREHLGFSTDLMKLILDIQIDVIAKRALVVVLQGEREAAPVDKILKVIESISPAYQPRWIPDSQTITFNYAITGLTSMQEARKLAIFLWEKLRVQVSEVKVNFSTKSVTIKAVIDESKKKIHTLINHLKRLIRSYGDMAITNESAVPVDKSEMDPYHYYKAAKYNILIVILLMTFSVFIPSPLTLLGQVCNLFIGGITLGAMWKTGKNFYSQAWRDFISFGKTGMNTMIALGTGSAWLYSMLLVTFPWFFPASALHTHFTAVAMILGIVNFGRWIREQALAKNRKQIQGFEQIYHNWQPKIARRLILSPFCDNDYSKPYETEEIDAKDIQIGDVLQVNSGERFPVDGNIVSPKVETSVNEELLTGEATLCNKTTGSKVLAGSENLKAPVLIKASCKGSASLISKIIQKASDSKAADEKSNISKVVDQVAKFFVPSILFISLFTVAGWLYFSYVLDIGWIVSCCMSVLLCACPCAIGLATPISKCIAVSQLFNRKIWVKNDNALEKLARVDMIVFDKTGTLTMPAIHKLSDSNKRNIFSLSGTFINEEQLLQWVASLEDACLKLPNGDHPIAKVFVNELLNLPLLKCEDVSKTACGVQGFVNISEKEKIELIVGNLLHLQENEIPIDSLFIEKEKENEKAGRTSIFVATKKEGEKVGECKAVIALHHMIRPDAKETIQQLKDLKFAIAMITGDKKIPSNQIAEELGIQVCEAGLSPKDKARKIEEFRSVHKKIICMVGDGINDLPALEKADVSLAIGPWTNAAMTADIALQNLNIVPLILIAKQTINNVYQNLLGTGLYNLFSLTAASGLLYPLIGVTLNPIIASISMAFSSIFVVLNSSRLAFIIDAVVADHNAAVAKAKGEVLPSQSIPLSFRQKLIDFLGIKTITKTLDMVFFNSSNTGTAPISQSMPPLSRQSSPPKQPKTSTGRGVNIGGNTPLRRGNTATRNALDGPSSKKALFIDLGEIKTEENSKCIINVDEDDKTVKAKM